MGHPRRRRSQVAAAFHKGVSQRSDWHSSETTDQDPQAPDAAASRAERYVPPRVQAGSACHPHSPISSRAAAIGNHRQAARRTLSILHFRAPMERQWRRGTGQLSPRCRSECLPMITTTTVRSRLCRYQCQDRDVGVDRFTVNRSTRLALGHYVLDIHAVNGHQFTLVLWFPKLAASSALAPDQAAIPVLPSARIDGST